MILAAMDRWRPKPGRLLRVVPTDASVTAAADAPVHPGPPSYLQEDHLRGYAALTARGGEHRAWTGVATTLPGPLDGDALLRALETFVARHEGMRSWFDLSGDAPVRHLVPVADVALELVEVAGPTGDDWQSGLQALLTDRFTESCRPDAWPGFALLVVDAGDEVGLVWGCDHAFTDGVSQVMVATELAALYAGEEPTEAPGSFLDHIPQERDLAASYAGSGEVAAWADLVTDHDGLPRFALDLGLGPGETAPVRIRSTDLLTGADLEAYDEACRSVGARGTGGIFGALAETERRLTGDPRYWAVSVLSTRGTGPWATAQGWFCTFAPVAFEVPDGSFGDLAAAAQAGFERAKRLGQVPVHVVLADLLGSGRLDPAAIGSPQLVSYLDLRWFPGVGTPAFDAGVHFTGEGRTGNASMWVNRDAERLYVVAQTPDTAQAQAAVTTYHEMLRGVLHEAARGRLGEPVGAGHHG